MTRRSRAVKRTRSIKRTRAVKRTRARTRTYYGGIGDHPPPPPPPPPSCAKTKSCQIGSIASGTYPNCNCLKV